MLYTQASQHQRQQRTLHAEHSRCKPQRLFHIAQLQIKKGFNQKAKAKIRVHLADLIETQYGINQPTASNVADPVYLRTAPPPQLEGF